MAVTIEKQFGRAALVETYRDPRQFLIKYNEAATIGNAKSGEKLAMFSLPASRGRATNEKVISKMLLVFAALIVFIGGLLAVGVPRQTTGRWVGRRIEWYEVGPGLPILYPGIFDYVYRDPSGKLIRHGPYHPYTLQSMTGI